MLFLNDYKLISSTLIFLILGMMYTLEEDRCAILSISAQMHTTNFEAKNNTYLSSHSVDVGRHVTVWLSCFSVLGLTGVSRAVTPPGSSGGELLLKLLAVWFCAVALTFPFPGCQSTAILSFQRPPIPWLTVPFFHLPSQQQQAGFSSGFKSL